MLSEVLLNKINLFRRFILKNRLYIVDPGDTIEKKIKNKHLVLNTGSSANDKIILFLFKNHIKMYMYPNTLYWDAALKSKNPGIGACIKHAFWPFLEYGFNSLHLSTRYYGTHRKELKFDKKAKKCTSLRFALSRKIRE